MRKKQKVVSGKQRSFDDRRLRSPSDQPGKKPSAAKPEDRALEELEEIGPQGGYGGTGPDQEPAQR